MKDSDFFASKYERREGDHYPTIDTRTIDGLLYYVPLSGRIVDPCAPKGSGIVDYLDSRGFDAHGVGDAFSDFEADWVVTNPPYLRSEVNKIVYAQIDRVRRREIRGAAFLVRSIFDFAKNRKEMFTSTAYAGRINLCFRVWWSDDREQEPKHNYVWHIWSFEEELKCLNKYYYAPYEERYTVRRKGKKQ